MPVTLKQVVDHVVAMEEPGTDRNRITAIVRETIGAVGLCVDARNDEVYNPAPAPSWAQQRQQNVRWRGGRRGR